MKPDEVDSALSGLAASDTFDFVVDLEASHGSTIVDSRTGQSYLDMFSFFGSLPLGMNHPQMSGDAEFVAELTRAAMCKPSNHEIRTVEAADFVRTFTRVVGDPGLPHLFFVEGGALAVDNALKVAFDWKAQRNQRAGRAEGLGTKVIHLEWAFHGVSGYALSLTNTDPSATARFPRFNWPRVSSPAVHFPVEDSLPELMAAERRSLRQIEEVLRDNPHDVAAFVYEPIQCQGGDRHLRGEYLRAVERLCHQHDVLLIADEVQTGMGASGTAWAHQQLGLRPDVVAFGKKVQVCGIMAGRRVDEVRQNVFRAPNRISSTWGGGLVDMVRSRRILEVIEGHHLIPRAAALGAHLLDRLTDLCVRHRHLVGNPRGRGLLAAVSAGAPRLRDRIVRRAREEERLLLLPCGPDAIRFRPALTVSTTDLDSAIDRLDGVITRIADEQADLGELRIVAAGHPDRTARPTAAARPGRLVPPFSPLRY